MKKNILLTFIFSFIPGAGQMYQEYMKRGLSLMILAAIFLILAIITGAIIFIIPIFIIMAYSFFDTYNIRNRNEEQKLQLIDDYIWNNKELGISIKNSKITNNRKIIGYVLISVGSYILMDSVIFNLICQLDIAWLSDLCYMLSRYTPTLIASIVAIILGVKLVATKNRED